MRADSGSSISATTLEEGGGSKVFAECLELLLGHARPTLSAAVSWKAANLAGSSLKRSIEHRPPAMRKKFGVRSSYLGAEGLH